MDILLACERRFRMYPLQKSPGVQYAGIRNSSQSGDTKLQASTKGQRKRCHLGYLYLGTIRSVRRSERHTKARRKCYPARHSVTRNSGFYCCHHPPTSNQLASNLQVCRIFITTSKHLRKVGRLRDPNRRIDLNTSIGLQERWHQLLL